MPSTKKPRLQKIDEIHLPDHVRLTAEDRCWFFYEYTAQEGYDYSQTNSLISNLKKSPTKRGKQEYAYKTHAVRRCAEIFTGSLSPSWLQQATLVPVPPSKIRGHPEYDDRVTQICRGIVSDHALDVRELVVQTKSMDAAHVSQVRPSVEDLLAVYEIDESLCNPPPRLIGIIDDVLTAGTHFRAMQVLLSSRFRGVQIDGLFIARRVFPEVTREFEAVEI